MYRVIATLVLFFLHVSYGVDETDELAVVTLTDKDFDETTKTGIWMVKFYAVRFYKVNTSITLNNYEFYSLGADTANTWHRYMKKLQRRILMTIFISVKWTRRAKPRWRIDTTFTVIRGCSLNRMTVR